MCGVIPQMVWIVMNLIVLVYADWLCVKSPTPIVYYIDLDVFGYNVDVINIFPDCDTSCLNNAKVLV